MLKKLEEKGYVKYRPREGVELTNKGRTIATRILRNHRLIETLMKKTLRKDIDEDVACGIEHHLSEEIANAICTSLGHPPLCPHGNPIPRGECCVKFRKEVKPLVMPLRDLEPGEEGRIVFIVPKEHTRLDRLSSLGVLPGSTIKLRQKRPSFVIKIGETELAIDEEIAREIYVRKKG